MQTFSAKQLIEFSTQVFLPFGIPQSDAELAAEVLSLSDLRGIDSHDVAKLHTYFDMHTLGKINPKSNIKIVQDKKSVCTVDGDNGLGLVVGKGAGHFFGDIQIDGFMEVDEFKKRIDQWIDVFRNTKPAKGTSGVLIPGDPEHAEEAIRRKNGIPLREAVVNDLKDISKQTGIPFQN